MRKDPATIITKLQIEDHNDVETTRNETGNAWMIIQNTAANNWPYTVQKNTRVRDLPRGSECRSTSGYSKEKKIEIEQTQTSKKLHTMEQKDTHLQRNSETSFRDF